MDEAAKGRLEALLRLRGSSRGLKGSELESFVTGTVKRMEAAGKVKKE